MVAIFMGVFHIVNQQKLRMNPQILHCLNTQGSRLGPKFKPQAHLDTSKGYTFIITIVIIIIVIIIPGTTQDADLVVSTRSDSQTTPETVNSGSAILSKSLVLFVTLPIVSTLVVSFIKYIF